MACSLLHVHQYLLVLLIPITFSRLFPELVEQECSIDGFSPDSFYSNSHYGRSDYSPDGSPIPTHRPNLPNELNRPYKPHSHGHGPGHGRPVHVVPPPRRLNDRYPQFHKISRSFLTPYYDLGMNSTDDSRQYALEVPIYPVLGGGIYVRKRNERKTQTGRTLVKIESTKAIDLIF